MKNLVRLSFFFWSNFSNYPYNVINFIWCISISPVSCIKHMISIYLLSSLFYLSLCLMCVMPKVWVPKTERIRRPQQCKSIKGFYCQLEPGLPSHPAQWSLDESPKPRFTAVFISLEQRQGVGQGWLAAGVSWYLLIGQSSSFWLARVTISLIGQSYHPRKPRKHDSGIIFGLVHLSEPVMALVRL